ncbi:unnamed protein product [Mortierella alpina]
MQRRLPNMVFPAEFFLSAKKQNNRGILICFFYSGPRLVLPFLFPSFQPAPIQLPLHPTPSPIRPDQPGHHAPHSLALQASRCHPQQGNAQVLALGAASPRCRQFQLDNAFSAQANATASHGLYQTLGNSPFFAPRPLT